MGSHHLEFGFPSTHSTNSVSMALYLYALLQTTHRNLPVASLSSYVDFLTPLRPSALEGGIATQISAATAYYAAFIALVVYVFSIVFGRLYCAMHSFTDCIVGVTLGSSVFLVQLIWGETFEEWMRSPGWTVPFVVIMSGILLVNQHPQPIDDCPCFEDAIAFVSVVIGTTLGRWWEYRAGFTPEHGIFVDRTPGWQGQNVRDWFLWTTLCLLKCVIGVGFIFAWRILAKSAMHVVLPPIFRTLSTLFTLPSRRFYTPATDYDGSVPPHDIDGRVGLRPIPSVIDIPGMLQEGDSSASTGLDLPQYALGNRDGSSVTSRSSAAMREIDSTQSEYDSMKASFLSESEVHTPVSETDEAPNVQEPNLPKHYDADVITKMVVYTGIGFFGGNFMIIPFHYLGLGVH